MAKILQINKDKILIGLEDHSVIEASRNDFNFDIQESMIIDAYKHNDKYLFTTHANPHTNNQEFEPEVPGRIYVDKLTYGLLCFFVGMFGVHYFYSKKTIQGFTILAIFIVLSIFLGITTVNMLESIRYADMYNHQRSPHGMWLLSIVAILIFSAIMHINGIVILCKKANKNGNILV